MKKTIILIAGCPGTGKSYLAKQIMQVYKQLSLLSPDEIKEELFDAIGFDTIAQKDTLTMKAWDMYYTKMLAMMESEKAIVSEYPFSDKQRSTIHKYCLRYQYQPITLRMVTDLDVLYERQHERDLSPSRHLAHIMDHYHKGDDLQDRSKATGILRYATFIKRCTSRGYQTFALGPLLEVNATNIHAIPMDRILQWLEPFMEHSYI